MLGCGKHQVSETVAAASDLKEVIDVVESEEFEEQSGLIEKEDEEVGLNTMTPYEEMTEYLPHYDYTDGQGQVKSLNRDNFDRLTSIEDKEKLLDIYQKAYSMFNPK